MLKAMTFFLTLSSSIHFWLPTIAQAQELNTSKVEPQQVKYIEPNYSSDAPPGRERETTSRSICNVGELYNHDLVLNGLVPVKTRGLTTKEQPSLWINIEYPENSTTQTVTAQFSLEEVQSNTKVVKDFPVVLPSSSSIVKVEIPYTLEPDKWYRWYLVVDCSTIDKLQKNTVISTEGLIKRQQSLAKQKKEPEEMVLAYAVTGIWYDAIDQAARLKCKSEYDPKAAGIWSDLLTQVNLSNLIKRPLLCNKL